MPEEAYRTVHTAAGRRTSLRVAEPWYKDGLKFACTQCGNCCTGPPGYVWMNDDEIQKLADHLGVTPAHLYEHYLRRVGGTRGGRGGWSLREKRNKQGQHDCVFLVDLPGHTAAKPRRGCGIYPVRPLQCRTWPFWDGLLDSPRGWQEAKATCPGLDKGTRYTRGQIDRARHATTWDEATSK